MKKIVSTVLMASVLAGAFCACTPESPPLDPPKMISTGEPVAVNIQELNADQQDKYRRQYLNTSFELLKAQTGSNQNVMISPASIMLCMSMAEAGARGNTQSQMAAIWGGENDVNGQLSYAAEVMDRINNSQGVSLHAANSMWINQLVMEGFLKEEYVDFVRDTFGAEVQNQPFDDNTLGQINGWVRENTDNMIDKVLDHLNPNCGMVLVNAIAFDGSWGTQFEDYQIDENGTFTSASGEEQTATMLCGAEDWYLEGSGATGFIKYYEGGQYAFVVMLPDDETQSADEYLADITGDDFDEFLASASRPGLVNIKLPEFTYEYNCSLVGTLEGLGVTDAFDEADADFTGIAEFDNGRNMYVDNVIHKTFIEVSRTGTRAAAVTAMTLDVAGAVMDEDVKYVVCDRPFAYAIVDMETNTPVFIGTVNNI